VKGDGEQRATRGRADVWEGASPGAQVELLASRGIRATLARTAILESSNSNNAVNFGSGTKRVIVTWPAAWQGITSIWTGQHIHSLSNAAALSVGPNGDTNPTLRVKTNTASAATGIEVQSAAAASGVTLQTLSSGTNESVNIRPKGTGSCLISNGISGGTEFKVSYLSDYVTGIGSETNYVVLKAGGSNNAFFFNASGSNGPGITIASYLFFAFSSGSNSVNTQDTAIGRNAAGVVEVNNGSAGTLRWLLQAGRTRVTSDVTNATATMANLTDLSVSLLAGQKFHGRLILKCADSTATEGISIDFDGGDATMTSFAAGAGVLTGGTTVAVTTVSSALATDLNWTTITGETWIVVEFSGVVNVAGTFIPRFCQGTAHTSGTATVYAGSKLSIDYSAN
jgi:hypothetical protein